MTLTFSHITHLIKPKPDRASHNVSIIMRFFWTFHDWEIQYVLKVKREWQPHDYEKNVITDFFFALSFVQVCKCVK